MIINRNPLKTNCITTFLLFLFFVFPLASSVATLAKNLEIPDTPAGKVFTEFLSAFNTGELEKMRGFHSEYGSDPKTAERDMVFYGQWGTLEPESIVQSSDYEIVALVQTAKSREWLKFTMKVGDQSPHRLMGLRVIPASGPDLKPSTSSSAVEKTTDTDTVSSLGAYIEVLASEDKFSGVVLIAKGKTPLFEKVFGYSNKAEKIPNDMETKFNLGSMNKMFTAVSIAQLAEAGKLSFNDKVGKHLPDYPNQQVADNVTIHQLLTHTSGLGDYWNDNFFRHKSNIRTVADYLPLFVDEPLMFEPGQRYQYSNSGYIVLGVIIEKVSGKNYYDYVRDHIYQPAGMNSTDAYEFNKEIPNLAIGYTGSGGTGSRIDNRSSLPNKGGPAGGGYSTAYDLLRFSIALQQHKLLSPEFTAMVTTGKVDGGPGRYGYGFGEEKINGERIVGHSGGAPGIGGDVSIFSESGYTAVVLTNYDPDLMRPVVDKIREILLSN